MTCDVSRRDRQLVQIVDAALLDSMQRSGHWLVCKPGCTQCCVGVFAIDQLDVQRLQDGLAMLDETDPARASRVRRRSRESWERLSPDFPGNSSTGTLANDDQAAEEFENYANSEPCPALDPETGACDLYAHRPITCRIFGPPVRSEEGLGVCDLCYRDATTREIAACEMNLDSANALQSELVGDLQKAGCIGNTIVAFALAHPLLPPPQSLPA